MNARRAVLAAVAAWLVVVVVGSALAWAVISRAGEEVSGDSADVPSATGDPSTEGSRTPKGPRTKTSSPTDPTSSATPPGSSSPPPADAGPVQRTWQGPGGFVAVECRGRAASLLGAQADSGFLIEVNDRGPQRVEVEFEGQGDNDDQESRVRAFCVDGEPTFDVDTD